MYIYYSVYILYGIILDLNITCRRPLQRFQREAPAAMAALLHGLRGGTQLLKSIAPGGLDWWRGGSHILA